jgi:ABC-type multidrug transport system permease subunit
MKLQFRAALDEILGLFVDDGSLASFAAVLILLVAGAVKILDLPPLWGGLMLIVGLVAILIESLMRATRTGKKR